MKIMARPPSDYACHFKQLPHQSFRFTPPLANQVALDTEKKVESASVATALARNFPVPWTVGRIPKGKKSVYR
jgi:hypothetical protein